MSPGTYRAKCESWVKSRVLRKWLSTFSGWCHLGFHFLENGCHLESTGKNPTVKPEQALRVYWNLSHGQTKSLEQWQSRKKWLKIQKFRFNTNEQSRRQANPWEEYLYPDLLFYILQWKPQPWYRGLVSFLLHGGEEDVALEEAKLRLTLMELVVLLFIVDVGGWWSCWWGLNSLTAL